MAIPSAFQPIHGLRRRCPLPLPLEDLLLGAEPVLLVLAGFVTAAFIQLVGPLSYLVLSCDGTVPGIVAALPGALLGATTIFGFGCFWALGSNIRNL
jgi:hypothetical protein